MVYIDFEIKDFTSPLPNGMVSPSSDAHSVTPGRAAWAATSVGYNPFGTRRHRQGHALEMQWRQAMLKASLTPAQGSFARSESFKDMDPAEMGAVSFFLGQAQAKLFAHDFFQISRFVHYDHYLRRQGQPVSGTRPDFLGYRGRGFSIGVEAKGRIQHPRAAMIKGAKSQAQSLPKLKGYAAPLTYVHAAYFSRDHWSARLIDPPQTPRSTESVDPTLLTADYYEPIVAAVEGTQTRPELVHLNDGAVRYRRTYFEDTDIYVSVRDDIAETLRPAEDPPGGRSDPGRSRTLYDLSIGLDNENEDRPADYYEEVRDRVGTSFLGEDGVAVELGGSWSDWQAADG